MSTSMHRIPETKVILSTIPDRDAGADVLRFVEENGVGLVVVFSNDEEARNQGWRGLSELVRALESTRARVLVVQSRHGEPLNPLVLLETVFPAMREAEQRGESILLLCRSAWGRSAAATAAYLVATRGLEPGEASRRVWRDKLEETPLHHKMLPYKVRKLMGQLSGREGIGKNNSV